MKWTKNWYFCRHSSSINGKEYLKWIKMLWQSKILAALEWKIKSFRLKYGKKVRSTLLYWSHREKSKKKNKWRFLGASLTWATHFYKVEIFRERYLMNSSTFLIFNCDFIIQFLENFIKILTIVPNRACWTLGRWISA